MIQFPTMPRDNEEDLDRFIRDLQTAINRWVVQVEQRILDLEREAEANRA